MVAELVLWFELLLGVQMGGFGETYMEYQHAPIFVEIQIDAEYSPFRFWGEYRNEMSPGGIGDFTPKLDYYTVGFEIDYTDHISVGFERICYHPIATWDNHVEKFNGGNNQLYMKISNKQ